MTQFWLYAALLCAVAAGVVAWPRRRRAAVDREGVNVALYRQRLDELVREHREGRLSAQELATLTDELGAGLVLDADGRAMTAAVSTAWDRRVVFVVALLVPLIALVGYRQLGSIDDVALAGVTRTLEAAAAAPTQDGAVPHAGGDLKGLSDKLAQRLATRPDDADGWFLLGRTAVNLKDYARAAAAFAKVAALAPTAAAPLIYQAQAEFMQNDRRVTPQVRATIDRALALSPGEPAVLELLAVDAFERRDYRATLDFLNQGMGHDMPPEQRAYFAQGIAKARELLGEPPLPPGPAIGAPAGSAAAAAAGSAAGSAVGSGAAVDVSVDLAPGVRIAPDTTIFVVAKAVSGPPMPLAVQRRVAADLPFSVRLDAAAAMNPALTIASVPEVIVSARASRRGTPEHAADDIEVVSGPLRLAGQTVGLRLSLGAKSGAVASAPVAQDAAGIARPQATPTVPGRGSIGVGGMPTGVPTGVPSSVPNGVPSGSPTGTIVRVLVELGADVHVPAQTPVFVFAREPGGRAMPVAVRRLTVADLPTIVILDDSTAMQQAHNLSSVQRVEVVARVARSGGVRPARGDIEGRSAIVVPRTAKLVIPVLVDRLLP